MSSGSISHHGNTGRFRSRDGVTAVGAGRQRTGILPHSGSKYGKRWGWIAMTCLISWGCFSPWLETAPPLPEQHLQIRQQLVIHSDFRLPQRHRLIDALARQRDEVAATLALPRSEELIHVYLFGNVAKFHDQLERIYPGLEPRRAVFVKSDRQLVVLAHWGDRIAEDLRHEVAHAYLHAVLPTIPLWLDEGLAEYFEVPENTKGLNLPHIELLKGQQNRVEWKPDLRRLESLVELSELKQLDYAESWLWMHYLLETTPVRRQFLQNYLDALRVTGSTPPLSLEIRNFEPEYEQEVRRHLLNLIALHLP